MKQFIEIMVANRTYAYSKPVTTTVAGVEYTRDIAFYKTEFDLKKTININNIKEFTNRWIFMNDGEDYNVDLTYDEIKELIINPHF